MKIALVIEHFDAQRGGAGHVAVWLAAELVRRGHDVHVVCHDVRLRVGRYRQATLRASHDAAHSHRAHHEGDEALAQAGMTLHQLRGMRLQSAVGFRLFAARAGQLLARLRPDAAHSFTVACAGDIYHAHHGLYAAMQVQAAASRDTLAAASFKRLLLRLPGKQRTLLLLEQRALVGNDDVTPARFIVSPCAMVTRELADFYAVEMARVKEMPVPNLDAGSPVEADAAAERQWLRGHFGLADADRVALFVGHDFRRKGLRYAIEAIARTREWKLLVVGLGKTRESVDLADDLGIGPSRGRAAHVLFVGPTGEMDAVYAAGDALLLPTFYEPANLVLTEALAHGLPVVSTEFLGASELVKEHRVGAIVTAPRDIAGLARAIEDLPAPGTAKHAAMAARARSVRTGITGPAFADGLEALYKEVMREKAH